MLALAKLQHLPPQAWMAAFWGAWQAQQATFSTKGHATIMWGMGSISGSSGDGAGRQQQQQQQQQAVFARQVHAVARTAKAVAGVALQKLRLAALQQQQQSQAQQPAQQPVLEQGTAILQQAEQQQQQQPTTQPLLQQQQPPVSQPQLEAPMPHASAPAGEEQPQLLTSASLLHPTDCAMVLYGLARLGPSALDASFPPFWLAQARAQQANMNSQELATCLWALAKLRLQPPEPWLQQHLACSARLAACMSHRQLAMVLWGCARMRVSRLAGRRGGRDGPAVNVCCKHTPQPTRPARPPPPPSCCCCCCFCFLLSVPAQRAGHG
jgi:hypothetical protein